MKNLEIFTSLGEKKFYFSKLHEKNVCVICSKPPKKHKKITSFFNFFFGVEILILIKYLTMFSGEYIFYFYRSHGFLFWNIRYYDMLLKNK